MAWSALAILPVPVLADDFAAPSPLSRFVPADAGLCLEIQNLAEHSRQFLDSDLYRRLRAYPAFRRWSEQNRPQLAAIADELERRLGARPEDIWNKLLGRQALLAVWPPPGGEDHEASALVLIEVADSQLLARLVDRLVSAQREAGKWRATRQLQVAGREFHLHVLETDPQKSGLFLAAVGELGIMATSEQIVRDVLALRETTPRGPAALAGVQAYAEGIGRLAPAATLRLFINPRRWDEHLLADLRSKTPGSSESDAQLAVVETWQATDYLVMGAELGSRLAIEAYAKWNRAELPEAVGIFVDSVGGQAGLLDRVPADALVVLAGRIDLGSLLEHFGPPAAPGAQPLTVAEPTTGWFALLTLAGGLGPDFVTYIAPRPSSSTRLSSTAAGATSPGESLPASPNKSPNLAAIDWVVGIGTRPLDHANPEKSLAEVLAPLAKGTMEIMAAAANARTGTPTSRVKTTQVDGLVLTSIVGLESAYPAVGRLTASLEATFAVVGNAFWASTSPAAIQRAATLLPEQSLAQHPAVVRQLGQSASGGPRPAHFLYVDLAGLGQLMAQSPDLVGYLAKSKGLDRSTAERSWNELVALASLADCLIAAIALDDSGAAASLSISAE